MERESTLLASVEEVIKAGPDVVIIGSGPAGVAVAEHLYEEAAKLKIVVIERGGILTLTHFNNLFALGRRRTFINRFCEHLWEGDMREGILLPAIGGRGIAAGAHLRRFDSVDFNLWPDGIWPQAVITALEKWYPVAETRRRVFKGDPQGTAQDWAKEKLATLAPAFPALGIDVTDTGRVQIMRGYDSSASRLWQLLLRDHLSSEPRRFWVIPHTYATRFGWNGCLINSLDCIHDGLEKQRVQITACAFVLAASPVESARIILNSGLDRDVPAAGCYLADHIWHRARITVEAFEAKGLENEGINLIIAPQRDDCESLSGRFQVHLHGEQEDGLMVIDIGGFAAMNPNPGNAVTLAGVKDRFNTPKAQTRLKLALEDCSRGERLSDRILEVAGLLGVKEFITDRFPPEPFQPQYVKEKRIQIMPLGQSYHEAGTLRMGDNRSTSATDSQGKFHGTDNLYIADASLFPSIGIANPMLTITALGYHVADSLVQALSVRQALASA